MAMWNRCAICGRDIPVGELCYGIKNWHGEPTNGDTICSDCLVPENALTLTPPNESERAGLYGKYTVYKNKDGSLVTDCFILRPEKDPAAVAALRAYAAATDNAELAADIINWVGAEPNKPLTCGLVDRHGAPLRALDTVAADKFFVYAVRYGSHNVNPDNCAPAFQVGWYLEIVWAYPGFEDSVGRTEPLYDIDGVAARYPAHCADTTDGIDNLKFEKVTRRPPEGEEDNNG